MLHSSHFLCPQREREREREREKCPHSAVSVWTKRALNLLHSIALLRTHTSTDTHMRFNWLRKKERACISSKSGVSRSPEKRAAAVAVSLTIIIITTIFYCRIQRRAYSYTVVMVAHWQVKEGQQKEKELACSRTQASIRRPLNSSIHSIKWCPLQAPLCTCTCTCRPVVDSSSSSPF